MRIDRVNYIKSFLKEVFYMNSNDYATNYSLKEICSLENGKKYLVSLELPLSYGWYSDVNFVVKKGNEALYFPLQHKKNEDNKCYFEGEVCLDTRAIYHYYFTCKVNGFLRNVVNNQIRESKDLSLSDMEKLSVNFETPDWAKGKTMYHIFVDRFRRGSDEAIPEMPRRSVYKSFDEDMIVGPDKNGIWNADFYGGDLKGIEKSLNYLYSLGVSIIYLSPIVWSQSNHRYDAADYLNVDPYAGCNDDLRSLCDAAHRRGMKVVLDSVFNHTGNDSKYFNEYGTFDNIGAFQSEDSIYSKFYKKHLDNGQVYYDYWWGMKNLPVCDGNSLEWREFITGEGGVIDKWFELGIDGLRLDVADELTDEFIELIRKAVKRNKEDGFILGEVWKNPMRMGRGYIESGKGMDSVMNYSLVDALIRYFKYNDIDKLARIIREIKEEYPDDTINTLMNFTSTHDISRIINILSAYDFQEYGEWAWNPIDDDRNWQKNYQLTPEQYKHGRDMYEAYCFILNFMPGILSIFYGDEIGMQGMGNLPNRRPFTWNYMDKKLLRFFKELGKIRRNEEFLETAGLNILDINDSYFMFERILNDEKMLITVNKTDREFDYLVPSEYEKSDGGVYTLKKSLVGHLNPYGGVAVKSKK